MGEQFKGEVDTLQFTAGGFEVAGHGGAGSDDDSIVLSRKLRQRLSTLYSLAIAELDAFLFKQTDAAVDDGLVEFKVRNAVAQQTAGGLVLL